MDSVFVLGNVSKISFWKDIWCGKDPLCKVFPTLYSLTASKGAMVAEVWDISQGVGLDS